MCVQLSQHLSAQIAVEYSKHRNHFAFVFCFLSTILTSFNCARSKETLIVYYLRLIFFIIVHSHLYVLNYYVLRITAGSLLIELNLCQWLNLLQKKSLLFKQVAMRYALWCYFVAQISSNLVINV